MPVTTRPIIRTIRPAARSREIAQHKSAISMRATSTRDFWNSPEFKRRWTTASSCRGIWEAWRPPSDYLDTQRLKSQIAIGQPDDYLAGQIGYSKSKGNIDLLVFESWIFVGLAGSLHRSRRCSTIRILPTSIDYYGVGEWWIINSTIGMKFTPQFRRGSSSTMCSTRSRRSRRWRAAASAICPGRARTSPEFWGERFSWARTTSSVYTREGPNRRPK